MSLQLCKTVTKTVQKMHFGRNLRRGKAASKKMKTGMKEVYFLLYTKMKAPKNGFVEVAINKMLSYFSFALVETA